LKGESKRWKRETQIEREREIQREKDREFKGESKGGERE
jgi:hypothetical protein